MIRTRLVAVALAALAVSACGGDKTHDARLAKAGANPSLAALMKVADPQIGDRKAAACKACHTFDAGAPDMAGPNLHGVYGQQMGRNRPSFGYSAALRDAGGKWDDATLDAWLKNPQAVVPHTAMMFGGISDPLNRADVIAYLRSQGR
ncbi:MULTISPECIES: cytochrome c family protein [unclassified Novosphingobium]|uniref:c-type cytochrome n=1 Tax=unclassified Novosphingobium TaxID=2644732 RepID=UPI000D2FE4D9|nr:MULTISPECIES: c-type cytochrome [unclassified Novosphingobium]PTR12221.1 cytochrome c [Novosphingobium sp. GV055]PUB05622.1 cytochrome c [Novosphingobium sp. GV061]PUB21855.1 cytochrome c [Novosphingobium sp. GV079]PUB43628.1 cytochrome c [Novosphingobium sp. GV027]